MANFSAKFEINHLFWPFVQSFRIQSIVLGAVMCDPQKYKEIKAFQDFFPLISILIAFCKNFIAVFII